MEITIQSTLSSVPGRVTVSTNNDDTVERLIDAFCSNHNLGKRKDLVLRSHNQELLSPDSSVASAGLSNRDVVFLGTKDGLEQGWQCSPWWLLAAILLLLGSAGMVAISVIKAKGTTYPVDYGVVLDAGSSHTQLYVYDWDAWKKNGTAITRQTFTCRENTSISSDNINPGQAGDTLTGCLNQSLVNIPSSQQSNSPIYLGATAGMRLIDAVNRTRSNQIISSVHTTIAKYPYKFTDQASQARILTGQEEGSYGWVSANFLLNSFKQFGTVTTADHMMSLFSSIRPRRTVGALDMGGASTQITFVPDSHTNIPDDYSKSLLLYGAKYKVYTHSYLCYGLNEAMRRFKANLIQEHNGSLIIQNPCGALGHTTLENHTDIFEAPCVLGSGGRMPKNTTYELNGTSQSGLCLEKVQSLFNFSEKCNYDRCSFNGKFQPELHGSFLAFSGFYYTVSFLNLTKVQKSGKFSLQQFENAVAEWCNKSWDQMRFYQDPPSQIAQYCFEGSYLQTLLTKGYGFNTSNWDLLNFKKKVGNTDIGWSLGLMLNASNMIPAEYPSNPVSTVMFVLLLLLFVIFIVLSIAFAFHARHEAKRSLPRYDRFSNETNYGAI